MKRLFRKLAFILIGAVMGIVLVALYSAFLPVVLDLSLFPLLLILLVTLVWMSVVFMFSVPLHEAGHLVFGLATGYEFVSFRAGKTIWTKRDGKLVRGRCQVAGTAGQCLMAPPGQPDGAYPYVLYNLGGALFNLLGGALLLGIAFALPSLAGFLCASAGLTNLFMGLVNLLPLPDVCNDGVNLLALRKGAEARRAFWITLAANARLAQGARPLDLPADWTQPLPDFTEHTPALTFGLLVLEAARRMDAGDYDQTIALLNQLLQFPQVVPAQKLASEGDVLLLTLLTKGPGPEAGKLCTPKLLGALRAGKTSPPSQCTLYAAARLQTGSETDAQKARAAFEKAALTHPYPGETQLYRELFDAVDRKADALRGT